MVYLERKKKKEKIYLYLTKAGRINGKPRRIWQHYLGSEKKINELGFHLPNKDLRYRNLNFGGSIALNQIAQRIKLVETINKHSNKNRDQGLSVGEYMLIAILNRCLKPRPKMHLGDWYKKDYFSRIITIDHKILNSVTYCNHFAYFSEDVIMKIEAEIMSNMLKEFDLDLNLALYDPTNFYTYIVEHNEDQLARFGKSKQNQNGLRIINLSLVCTMDWGIPLFHKTYEGNTQDATHFKSVLSEIFDRFQFLNKKIDQITLIFDKGNHSANAFNQIADENLGFIASFRNSMVKDLLTVEGRELKSLFLKSNGKKVKYYQTSMEIYKVMRDVYLMLDLKKKKKELIHLWRKLKKKQKTITKFLEERLNDHKWREKENLVKHLKKLIGKTPYNEIIQFSVRGNYAELSVDIRFDKQNFARHCRTLGRSVIFTNRKDWEVHDIIQAFRNKYPVEDAFKQLKNPSILAIRPMHHWKDESIRVHVFICIIALLLLSLLRRELGINGINASINKIVNAFSEMQVTLVQHPWRKTEFVKLNYLEGLAANIYTTLNLQSFLPNNR